MMQSNETLAAQMWGNSEGNCATPEALYDSAMRQFTKQPTEMVYFTGDFSEAGASYPCHGSRSNETTAEDQIVDIMTQAWNAVKQAVPGVRIYGTLGNHDSAPGDVFTGTEDMAWLYTHIAHLWADDLGNDVDALSTLTKGGYYAVRAASNLTIISLNTNYLSETNPQMKSNTSAAFAMGKDMLNWFESELAKAKASSSAVHILGHIMYVQ